jgi:hypothetical protein
VSFAAITLCVAAQRVFIVVYFVIDSVRKLLDTPSYADKSIQIAIHLQWFWNRWYSIFMSVPEFYVPCYFWNVMEPMACFCDLENWKEV